MKKFIVIAALVAALASCKKDGTGPGLPPPISVGKCLADVYQGSMPTLQTCTFVGYSWTCNRVGDGATGRFDCKRGPEAAAVTERPAQPQEGK